MQNIVDPEESIGIIIHADAPDDANLLKSMINAKLPTMEIQVHYVGPVIGAHCGPGTVAFCFLGKERPF